MRAMILAAGRGERMGALTTNCPKPLLKVKGRYLIEYAIDRLREAGIKEIVINISYAAEQIKAALGTGEKFNVAIAYSEEAERLETGGGILQALPLLGPQPFVVISCDIMTDFPIQQLPKEPQGLAHLVMVNNPAYHPKGDYGLQNGFLQLGLQPQLTFGNISILRPALFTDCQPGHFKLSALFLPAIIKNQVTGEHYQGDWYNVGTPDDLLFVRSL